MLLFAAFSLAVARTLTPRLDTIVFSGQLHEIRRHKEPEINEVYKISEPTQAAHLYFFDKRGHRVALTHGREDDFVPRYSPSLGGLLFVRSKGSGKENRLMFLPTGASKPRQMGTLPHGEGCDASISFSGRTYVVESGTRQENLTRLTVVYDGHVIKMLPYAEFQVVPGIERLYVAGDGSSYFFDPATRKISKIGWSEEYVAWLNDRKALAHDYSDIRIRDIQGQILGTLLVSADEIGEMGPIEMLPEADRIHTDSVVMVDEDHISDGPHPMAYRVNLINGNVKDLFEGAWCDTNDRGEFLSLSWEWVGTYKRGNHRTGFLHRTSSNGKEKRQLTQYPMDVYDACWSPNPSR